MTKLWSMIAGVVGTGQGSTPRATGQGSTRRIMRVSAVDHAITKMEREEREMRRTLDLIRERRDIIQGRDD